MARKGLRGLTPAELMSLRVEGLRAQESVIDAMQRAHGVVARAPVLMGMLGVAVQSLKGLGMDEETLHGQVHEMYLSLPKPREVGRPN